MNLNRKEIDLSSSDVLIQLVKNIKAPLASIIEASEKFSRLNTSKSLNKKPSEVIFSSSQEIANLIEEVVKLATGDKAIERVPLIYEIYHSNERVKSMCKNELNPKKYPDKILSGL
ncbi:MAG: hypothetical protein JKY02_06795 [Flavobacteriaceae bacterium]|nr:hypothetical protein [Flavobacteriaceae bacterium]